MTARIRRVIRCASVLCITAGCGGSAPTPTAPAPPTVQGLSISPIPAVLQIGQQVTLTATVTLPDGAHKQALNVAWESSDPAVATISSTGVLTVTGYGESQVRASGYGQSATARAFAPPPPKIKLAVTVDPYGSTAGMCEVTNITFDMSGSSGTGLRYSIDYGDGISGGEMVARHAFACPDLATGLFLRSRHTHQVRATVTDTLARTDTAIATVNMLGNFDGLGLGGGSEFVSQDSSVSPRYLLFYRQSDVAASGTYVSDDDPTRSNRPFAATLTGDDDLNIGLNDGTIHMSGHLVFTPDPLRARIVLTFSGGSANGKTLTFALYTFYN